MIARHQIPYNGLGQRISQEVSSVITDYLLDVQPGLYKVLAATAGGNANRYIHDPVTGQITQHEDPTGEWHFLTHDGLGSVRHVYDDTLSEVYAVERDPYGVEIADTGANPTPFEYTGEPLDPNGLLHLRARYYDPSLGVFVSLDPLETDNQYGYVEGTPVNYRDPSGLYSIPMPNDYGVTCSNETNRDCMTLDDCRVVEVPVYRGNTQALELAQKYGKCLLCNIYNYRSISDLEKFAMMSDYVSVLKPTKDDYLWVMTKLILGENATLGMFAALVEFGENRWGYHGENEENTKPCCIAYPNDSMRRKKCECEWPCPNDSNRVLNDSGFHPDFRDSNLPGGGNQVFHFWGSVATVAPAGNFVERGILTKWAYLGFQVFHEAIQPKASGGIAYTNNGNPYAASGAIGGSWQDIALTNMGITLGRLISKDKIAPRDVGKWLRDNLGIDSKGAEGMLDVALFDASGLGAADSSMVSEYASGLYNGIKSIKDCSLSISIYDPWKSPSICDLW